MADYSTFITQQDGSRHYLINYFFFLKIDKEEFERQFHSGPLKTFLKLEQIGTEKFILDPNAESKLKTQLEICEFLINDEYMIVPFCASLISRHPFIEQSVLCLDKLVKMFFDSNISESNFLFYLQYLIKSIIIPSPNKLLNFYIPNHKFPIKIPGRQIENLPIANSSFWKLLKYFSAQTIVLVFQLVVLEKKIFFVAKKHKNLTEIIDCFISLIYPFQYF